MRKKKTENIGRGELPRIPMPLMRCSVKQSSRQEAITETGPSLFYFSLRLPLLLFFLSFNSTPYNAIIIKVINRRRKKKCSLYRTLFFFYVKLNQNKIREKIGTDI